jgi:mannose-1-phosphate guanylyltransferase/mannose-1-phosphate guanylyltransferase/mannose-6-phosphate isomerase
MITPVILCGGAGTRLWPLSRKSFPKQFAPLVGDGSLFQQAARRLSGDGFAAPLVVTGEAFRFIVTEQLDQAGVGSCPILIEPAARNTAPAILAAALSVTPQTLLLVTPSDHLLPDAAGFRAAVARGVPAALQGQIVTFGIRPTRPETGYGYLELDGMAGDGDGCIRLQRFVEKPDASTATAFVAGGRHLWNAGIFLFTAQTLIDAFAAHAPDFLPPVRQSVAGAARDLGFLRLAPGPWADLPDRSIDVAVMEPATNLTVVPYDGEWSDLGGWDAVWAASGPDEKGVVAGPGTIAVDCRDTLLRSESAATELVGIGLSNIVAIALPDAVLVADASRAQEVRLAVAALKARGAPQAEEFPTDHRPWGWFETLVLGDRFRVKRIHVHPGAALSLQSHVHRSEHWIVVEGTARVTVGDSVRLVTENQSVYVPLGERHRLENPGKLPMVLIEVQTGSYLGEDDIVRYDDTYARR